MNIRFENTPEYLREHGFFCLWKYEDRDGRKTKVPYDPRRPQDRGDSSDRTKFVDYDQIKQVWEQAKTGFTGVGVGIFDGVCAVDIDHCYKGEKLSDLARDIILTMDSYTEVSPSGEGIRIFFRGGKPYDRERYYINNHSTGLEIYICGMTAKYLTFTGKAIHKGDVQERGDQIAMILDKYMKRPEPEKRTAVTPITPTVEIELSDMELIDKAASATNGDRFRALWSGDASGYNSRSEADQALCNMLAFWTGRDAGRMDSLYRQSGLMRTKWDRKQSGSTYGKITIQKAIKSCGEVYSPRQEVIPFPQMRSQKETAGEPKPEETSTMIFTVETPSKPETLEPTDYTDLGQAEVFCEQYGSRVKYSRATGYLVYDGKVWNESDLDAQRLAQELTAGQLTEARQRLRAAQDALTAAQEAEDEGQIRQAKGQVTKAKAYHSYVLKRRGSFAIAATLRESAPSLQIPVEQLDRDPFLLNCPAGTIDLRTGELRPHKAEDYCTRICGCSPSDDNADLWSEFLDSITCGDCDLAKYLQMCAGMIAVGHVYTEKLLIAFGTGGNGKSSTFNLWSKVLGTYSISIPSDSLIVKRNQSKDYALANLRGKRFAIAAELQEGQRLSTDVVKKLCSTDVIAAERKYRDPFAFTPSHSIVLYTNHLPEIGTNDGGTWDRISAIPFGARFRNSDSEIKDYASYLFEHCGGAVLNWIVQGAVKFIHSGFKISDPTCVVEAIGKYRDDSDWLHLFILDQCEVRGDYEVGASDLYAKYTDYCSRIGEQRRSQKEFRAAMELAGYKQKRNKHGIVYCGLRLPEWQTTDDSRNPFSFSA